MSVISHSLGGQAANKPNSRLSEGTGNGVGFGQINPARLEALGNEQIVELTKGLIRNTKNEVGKAGGLKRFFANFSAMEESPVGASVILFIQDTMAVWLPKMMVVRSLAEGIEATFLEFVESALFYFTAPMLGQHVFSHWMHKKLGNNHKGTPDYVKRVDIAQSMEKLNNQVNLEKLAKEWTTGLGATTAGKQMKKIIAMKFGTILATMSVVTLEYSLSFVKNLLTLGLFKTGDFNEVANLNTDNHFKNKEELEADNRTRRKSIRRVVQGLGVATAFMASGLVVARNGGKSKWLFNRGRKLLTGFRLPDKKWLGAFRDTQWGADFSYSRVFKRKGSGIKGWFKKGPKKPNYKMEEVAKNAAVKSGGKQEKLIAKFGLSNAQKFFIIGVGGLSYLDATRNRLEFVETAARVWLVTVPYLTVINDMIKKAQQKLFHGEVKGLFKFLTPGKKTLDRHLAIADRNDKGEIAGYKKMPEITRMALERAGLSDTAFPKTPNPYQAFNWINSADTNLQKAGREFWKLMMPKITSVLLPLGFGMTVTGFAVAKLNRYWTAVRYQNGREKELKERFQRVNSGLNRPAVQMPPSMRGAQATA